MKQFLYIATLFVALFFSYMDGNVAYGQNMAREYNPNSPWNQADKTGEYHEERCFYCDEWITGYSESELDEAMTKHIKDKHPQYDPDSDDTSIPDFDNGSSGGASGGSSGNQYSNEASLVYVSNVACAMQIIGQCNYNDFINDCQWYGISTNDNSASASKIVNYIQIKYNVKSNIDLKTAISRRYNFIIFARPNSGKYYNVYTNYDIGHIGSIKYDYLIVF